MDEDDWLEAACEQAAKYPTEKTYQASDVPPSVRGNYLYRLWDNQGLLFDGRRPSLVFVEKARKDETYSTKNVHKYKDLQEHLSMRKDPDCRHVFIEANNSRAPMNCTLPMLQLLLTFLQVNPIFLDSMHAFGDHMDAVDAPLCQFQFDSHACGGLRKKDKEAKHPWSIRQTAVYHAFDLETGRAFWISIKSNNIQDAIKIDTAGYQGQDSIAQPFLFTLKTHLVYIRWCQESWPWFVRDLENEVRNTLIRARTTPVGREPYFDDDEYAYGGANDQNVAGHRRRCMSGSLAVLKSTLKKAGLPLIRIHSNGEYSNEQSNTRQLWRSGTARHWPGPSRILKSFNFEDLQRLNIIGERIQEAVLVIKLDSKALAELRMYYQNLKGQSEFPEECSKHLPPFLEKVQSAVDCMETRRIQLESLTQRLEEGKRLNLEMSRVYAEEAKQTATHMEKIAFRSANETSSMHIITIVTLIFLPGTFVATFFQSGVLQWQDAGYIQENWLFRPAIFHLFLAICLPLMFVIFLAWSLTSCYGERRYRQHVFNNTESTHPGKRRLEC
ncbi:uncharacterized protein F4822DRAFT_428379 [Hypoxylon trugodes]|uniref:uncharacterized protein n=1 Tax=Hypoxylon trugodes TaxID=326681 RepID=UPI002197373E|nr:uncharacterized protein F4822DRAFT_428379 [Hypoxylon trugodes]KAI1390033.1 hypothetical protein F4822DRAFT_428379 [Hypoxylon trugodes]